MNSAQDNFSVEDCNFMNAIETMNCLINSNDTTVPKELNIDTTTDHILNYHLIEDDTHNSVNNEHMCLEKFEVLNNKYDCHSDDLNYDILDLDNWEYITHNNKKNKATEFFGGHSKINYFLLEHNYCMTKETTPASVETLDTSKITDFYKTEENSFNERDKFNGVDYKVIDLDEVPEFCSTDCDLQELNFEFVNFETVPNHLSTGNIDIYTISDDEQQNDDIKLPELDVISISSGSFIEDNLEDINESDTNSCGYHSSDFEFIDEHEAKKDGLIINYNPQTIIKTNYDKVKTTKISKELNSEELVPDYCNVPAFKNNIEHEIPQDTNYISMFERNIPYPAHCMENKSIYTNNCSMLAEYQNLGFNMSLYGREKVEKHVRDEACESMNKIISMYPSENRIHKRRRI